MSKTATITITLHHNDPRARYHVRLSGLPGRKSAPFDWPSDLERWVRSTRRDAERLGYAVTVDDRT